MEEELRIRVSKELKAKVKKIIEELEIEEISNKNISTGNFES